MKNRRWRLLFWIALLVQLCALTLTLCGCEKGEYKRFSAREGHTHIACYFPSDFTQVHEGNYVHKFLDNFIPENFPIAFYHVTGEITYDVAIYISKYEEGTTMEEAKRRLLNYTGTNDKFLEETIITISGIAATKITIWSDTVPIWKPSKLGPMCGPGNFCPQFFEESPTIGENIFLEYNNEIWEIVIAYNESKLDQFQRDFDYFIQTFKIWE